jgi:branched-chain amino acid transport system substrate-binding protein
MKLSKAVLVASLAGLTLASGAFAQPIKIVNIAELSGLGATSGTNFKQGAELAVKEINAAGGILGRKIDFVAYDTQSNPGIAKSLAARAVDENAYVILGPGFSGSMVVSMSETRRAEVPNFTAAEATTITQQGNPYVFRTSFSQARSMPKVANYLANELKAKSVVVVYINSEFGKGAATRWSRSSRREASRSPRTFPPTLARSTSPASCSRRSRRTRTCCFLT